MIWTQGATRQFYVKLSCNEKTTPQTKLVNEHSQQGKVCIVMPAFEMLDLYVVEIHKFP